MTFNETIFFLSEFLISIRKLEDFITFDLRIPEKWGIPKSIVDEGKLVPFDLQDDGFKGYSFVCSISDSEIDMTIDKIKKTIKLNKDKEIKEKLFKETIDSLKKTFEKNDLEKLKNLYFDFKIEQPLIDDTEERQISDDIELA
jgi:hypothetical protein